jgi:hypothetical protein
MSNSPQPTSWSRAERAERAPPPRSFSACWDGSRVGSLRPGTLASRCRAIGFQVLRLPSSQEEGDSCGSASPNIVLGLMPTTPGMQRVRKASLAITRRGRAWRAPGIQGRKGSGAVKPRPQLARKPHAGGIGRLLHEDRIVLEHGGDCLDRLQHLVKLGVRAPALRYLVVVIVEL